MALRSDLRHISARREAFRWHLMSLRVAIVCPQPELRMTAVKAFDRAPLDWDLRLVSQPTADADVVVGVGADALGDLTLDPAHPEKIVDQILESRSDPDVIAVVGSSGGCGATSVALHLAAALARTNRVNVLDLHPSADAALRLGLMPEEIPVDDGSATLPIAGGFRLALGPEAGRLQLARAGADKIVIDLPREALPEIETQARIVLVMTPTRPSVHKAARLLEQHPDRAWIPVTNRTGPGSETTRVDIERILGRRLAIELPCSPGLRDAEDDMRLLTAPLSPWRMAVQRLADAL